MVPLNEDSLFGSTPDVIRFDFPLPNKINRLATSTNLLIFISTYKNCSFCEKNTWSDFYIDLFTDCDEDLSNEFGEFSHTSLTPGFSLTEVYGNEISYDGCREQCDHFNCSAFSFGYYDCKVFVQNYTLSQNTVLNNFFRSYGYTAYVRKCNHE